MPGKRRGVRKVTKRKVSRKARRGVRKKKRTTRGSYPGPRASR